jgi:hypothetical protein
MIVCKPNNFRKQLGIGRKKHGGCPTKKTLTPIDAIRLKIGWGRFNGPFTQQANRLLKKLR